MFNLSIIRLSVLLFEYFYRSWMLMVFYSRYLHCFLWRICHILVYYILLTKIIGPNIEILEQFSMKCHKTKSKAILQLLLWPITTEQNSAVRQSEFKAVTCNQGKVWENACMQVPLLVLVLLFISWKRGASLLASHKAKQCKSNSNAIYFQHWIEKALYVNDMLMNMCIFHTKVFEVKWKTEAEVAK